MDQRSIFCPTPHDHQLAACTCAQPLMRTTSASSRWKSKGGNRISTWKTHSGGLQSSFCFCGVLATRYGAFLMDVWMSSFRCEAAQVDYMSQLPIEIAIDIISSLSKFSDIAAVTSTCQHMRAIWLEHADIIYRRALKNTVEFETECRALLVDQGYARNHPTLSHLDVCRLVRNNRKASKSAERFGIEVASHVSGESSWF